MFPPMTRTPLTPPRGSAFENCGVEPTRNVDPEDALAAPLAALVRYVRDSVSVTVDAKNDVLRHGDDPGRAARRTSSPP